MTQDQQVRPKSFVCHSHADKELARRVAEALQANGIDVWFDEWEIKPGDSLVQKIFEEGLKNCQLFLVLLSPASIGSNWVRHELDSAIIQRLSGVTRVVPLVVEPCEIPVALRPLLRLDLHVEGFQSVIEKLVDVAFGRSRKPPVGTPPSGLDVAVPGLSNHAGRLAIAMSQYLDRADGQPVAFSGEAIAEGLKISPEQVNDAVDELEALGLVRTMKWLGTTPFDFGQVEPTPSLALQLRGTPALSYDPEDDIRLVAAAVVQLKQVDGKTIMDNTGLSPSRINAAVSYLEDYGLVKVQKFLGTAPFRFGVLMATRETRQFVDKNS